MSNQEDPGREARRAALPARVRSAAELLESAHAVAMELNASGYSIDARGASGVDFMRLCLAAVGIAEARSGKAGS